MWLANRYAAVGHRDSGLYRLLGTPLQPFDLLRQFERHAHGRRFAGMRVLGMRVLDTLRYLAQRHVQRCEFGNRLNRLLKHLAKLVCRAVRQRLQLERSRRCRCSAQGNLFFEAGHRPVGNSARIDELEVVQIGGHIKGESVRGDPARDVNANGADFALPRRRI